MTIHIDKGVPLPTNNGRRGGRLTTTPEIIEFKRMGIGDSFLVAEARAGKIRAGVAQWCRRAKPTEYHYTSATEYDPAGKKFVRIWKTKPKGNHVN